MLREASYQLLSRGSACAFLSRIAAPAVVRCLSGAVEASPSPSSEHSDQAASLSATLHSKQRLWVGNIPWRARHKDVKDLFARYGATSVFFFYEDKTKKFRGMAYVHVDPDKAEKAVAEMNAKDFQGRALSVRISTPTRRSASAPGEAPSPELSAAPQQQQQQQPAAAARSETQPPAAPAAAPQPPVTGVTTPQHQPNPAAAPPAAAPEAAATPAAPASL